VTPAERSFQAFLAGAVELATYDPDHDGDHDGLPEADPDQQVSIRTFEEAGLLTNNAGLIISYGDGDQFQITIIHSGCCSPTSWC
jgi:hypothetical protein